MACSYVLIRHEGFYFAESECEWPHTEENVRRQEFCNHIEGYGSVCSCSDPAVLTFDPQPVSQPQHCRLNTLHYASLAS